MTLVEILAVVVILALIAGTLTYLLGGSVGRARRGLAKSGVQLISQRVEQYRIEHGRLPEPSVGLGALLEGSAKPDDPWFVGAEQAKDPWGNQYVLVIPGPSGYPYEVVSFGADGDYGGDGENADISSVGGDE